MFQLRHCQPKEKEVILLENEYLPRRQKVRQSGQRQLELLSPRPEGEFLHQWHDYICVFAFELTSDGYSVSYSIEEMQS